MISFIGVGYLLGLILIGVLFLFLSEKIDKTYDGWFFKGNEIELSRLSLFKGKESIFLQYSGIKKVTYIQSGPYTPLLFEFDLGFNKVNLNPRMSIFKCAFILKELKENGIPIEFNESDKEVELYINGELETIPMGNS